MSAAARAAAPSVWSLTTRTGRLRVPRVRKQILVDMARSLLLRTSRRTH